MYPSGTETEVKIYMPDLDRFRDLLEEMGAELIQARVHETNTRYDYADGSLTQRGIVVRLRADRRNRLTYKEPGSIERGIITRDELEVDVSDFKEMEAILAKLGLTPSMIYEKYRTTYAFNDTHIMLDEMPYGNFIEIEGDQDAIERVIEQLGLEQFERRPYSYAKLFSYVKHHLELKFRDLTFANFADIEVSEEDFIPPGSIVVG